MNTFSDEDKFTSGNFEPVGFTAYRLEFFNTMWMLEAVMQALSTMISPDNWNTVGSLSPDTCAQFATDMLERFRPTVNMIGVCTPFGGETLPEGALWCDGSTYSRAAHPALFAVIGTNFGSTSDANFKVPDMSGRTLVGNDSVRALGDKFGEAEVTLTALQMPSHVHLIAASIPAVVVSPGEDPVFGINVLSPIGETDPAGGDDPHANYQPSIVMNYIIWEV